MPPVQRPDNRPPQNNGQREQRVQQYPPRSHMYHQMKLATVYINWTGRANLIVVPFQQVRDIADFYPLDLTHIFNECRGMLLQNGIRNYQYHIYQKSWEVSPHVHMRISMHPQVYAEFINKGPLLAQGQGPYMSAPPVHGPLPVPPTPNQQGTSPAEEKDTCASEETADRASQ